MALIVPIYETKGYAGLVSLAGEVEVTSQVKSTLTVASVFVHNRLVTLEPREVVARRSPDRT